MDLLTSASLLQDSIKFITETKPKQNLSNKKENIDQSDIQRTSEDNSGNESTEQYNQIFWYIQRFTILDMESRGT